ncbi:MAG TPA: hypothetical protein PLS03_10915 [Terrimicrobiaceae bacterium]|nr:hypothetical protein [Terrimicrobiaceae bacterium]
MTIPKTAAAWLLFTVSAGFAGDPSPYDRLSKDNVTMKVSVGGSGSTMTDQSLKTDYGTYAKDMKSEREMIVEIPILKSGHAVPKIEAFCFFRDHGSSKTQAKKAEVKEVGPQRFSFVLEAENRRERWMYADNGKVTQYGEKILGWCVRAVANDKIVGIAGSSTKFEELAARPQAIELAEAK